MRSAASFPNLLDFVCVVAPTAAAVAAVLLMFLLGVSSNLENQ